MYFSLALKNILRNKRRSGFTMLAVLFGVTIIVFAGSFLKGMFRIWAESQMTEQYGAFQIEHKDYLALSKNQPLQVTFEDGEAIRQQVLAMPGIVAAYGELRLSGLISNGTKSIYFIGKGVDSLNLQKTLVGQNRLLKAGRLLGTDSLEVVLGQLLAEKLDVGPGDQVGLAVKTFQGSLNLMYAKVVGVKNGSHFDSSAYVELQLATAQQLLRMPGRVSQLVVRINDFSRVLAVVQAVKQRLRIGNSQLVVRDYTELIDYYATVGGAFKLLNLVVSLVLFIVVSGGIANAMFMAVRERKKEIGTMLAIGMEPFQVRGLFLAEGLLLGFLGSLLGAGTGLLVTLLVIWHGGISFPLGTLIPEISWSSLAFALVTAAIISVAAAWLPAATSARLSPIEALQEY